MLLALVLYTIDFSIRMYHLFGRKVEVLEVAPIKNGTRLKLRQEGLDWHAGQCVVIFRIETPSLTSGRYLYLHISKFGLLQLHPMSISSSPADGYVSLRAILPTSHVYVAAADPSDRYSRLRPRLVAQTPPPA